MPLPTSGIAVPGQPLGTTAEFIPGTGIHIRKDGQLSANIVGRIHISPTTTPQPSPSSPPPGHHQPSNNHQPGNSSPASRQHSPMPWYGGDGGWAVAAATSTSIPTGDTFPGVIRVQDVRATEKDKVRIASSFKPGDIVRAAVISLGDQSNYYLSTGRNELGVVVARTDSGDLLYPKSWKEMICSRTGIVEERKVAKPI
ncbi:hypothetical protein BGX38DRAFT_1181517 [Terfezia claveryi]|nr:hypothetical protein BGX38DRAFT_1181517 [Terfezia claveryi]